VPRIAPTDSAAGATAPPTLDGRTRLALAGIVALGAALRLYGLDRQSMWNDELGMITDIAWPTMRDVFMLGPEPSLIPGYWMIMYVWTHAFGTSEAAMRLPSALFGIATIPAMFALGRRWYGRCEGLIAAAITAVAWMPLYYSQEARPYALLLLGAVLSTAWLTDIVVPLRAGTAPPRRALFLYGAATIGTVYSHYFGLAFIGLQAATAMLLLIRRPRTLLPLAAVYGVVLVTFVPVLYRAWLVAPKAPNWLERPHLDALWVLLAFFFDRSDAFVWLVLSLGAAATLRTFVRRSAVAPATLLLIAWLVIPVVSTFLYSQWAAPCFLERTLIFVAPPAYLLLARALMQLPVPQLGATALVAPHPRRRRAGPADAHEGQFARRRLSGGGTIPATSRRCSCLCVEWRVLRPPPCSARGRRGGSAHHLEPGDAAAVFAVADRQPKRLGARGHRLHTELLRARRAARVDEQHFIKTGVCGISARRPGDAENDARPYQRILDQPRFAAGSANHRDQGPQMSAHLRSADELVATAIERTGRSDFGDDSFREGLDRLVHARRPSPRSTGSAVVLHELLPTPVQPSSSRTGSFATQASRTTDRLAFICTRPPARVRPLSCLLAEDPAARSLRRWEAGQPCPPPAVVEVSTPHPQAEAEDAMQREFAPRLAALVPTSGHGPEVPDLMGLDFRSATSSVRPRPARHGCWKTSPRPTATSAGRSSCCSGANLTDGPGG
jgi:hypothetical protein